MLLPYPICAALKAVSSTGVLRASHARAAGHQYKCNISIHVSPPDRSATLALQAQPRCSFFVQINPPAVQADTSNFAPDPSENGASDSRQNGAASPSTPQQSISTMSTAEWRAKYERDGCVDLWVEEEFNAGSRLVVGSIASATWASSHVM